jgi:hypothetical protein
MDQVGRTGAVVAFGRCSREDPFTRQVRTLYRANVLRVPRAGVEPLDVLLARDRHIQHQGRLAGMLAGMGQLELPEPTTYPVADLSGLRSVGLDLSLGLKLSAGFLTSLGVPAPGVGLNASLWKGARSLQFEVREVTERRMDLGALGRSLKGWKIDTTSPSMSIVTTESKVRMLVLTRTFVSRRFAIHSTSDDGQSVDISIDAIENLLGESKAGVEWNREAGHTVTFSGRTGVTFAFAAVPCAIQQDGSFLFGLESSDLTFGESTTTVPVNRPVIDEDGLLDFD